MPRAKPSRLDIGRLPVPGPNFVGREAELAQLDEAWKSPGIHVLTLVAFGGIGKSALVSHWIDKTSKNGWRGAVALDWSFSSQGTEARVASAAPFLDHALDFFGDPDPAAGTPHDRGARLAELMRRKRSLLVLDGVEPLQYLSGPLEGQLKDPGLKALLKGLAVGNPGLCLVTTRAPIADLNSFSHTAPQLKLGELSPQEGVELLRTLRVDGPDSELRAAVRETRGHALTLTLLGNYLHRACEGDIRRRREVRLHEADERLGRRAFQVIAAYARWLEEGPELEILRVLGLFDRSADAEALSALKAGPPIPKLTGNLVRLTEKDWRWAVTSLQEHGLLAPSEGGRESGSLDAHPLVRAYFEKELKQNFSEAWREGHLRLYEHYCKKAPDLPSTLEDMQPLFEAIVHGCRAGKPQNALEVYNRRILREGGFSWKTLGASGPELNALAGFFDRPWDQPVADLSKNAHAFISNEAGMRLRSLGRLREAVEPLELSLKAYIDLEKWQDAATLASNLGELHLTLGEVKKAVKLGQQCVELADLSRNPFWRIVGRARVADALHQAGQHKKSAEAFQEAETLQAQRGSEYKMLFSLRGFHYCDLLLAQAEPPDGSALDGLAAAPVKAERYRQACNEVLERATQTLKWEEERSEPSLFHIALDHLTLSHAQLGLAATLPQPDAIEEKARLTQAQEHVDQAVNKLRHSDQEGHLPRALLARSALRLYQHDFRGAAVDLTEAQEIAEASSMRLHACDAHRGWARYYLQRDQEGDAEAARRHTTQARRLVRETGYSRRERDVAYLEQRLAALPSLAAGSIEIEKDTPAVQDGMGQEAAFPSTSAPPSVFISYSNVNKNWLKRLEDQLNVLALQERLDVWSDQKIGDGDDWRTAITEAMERAQVAVLLISAKFLTSDFIQEEEVPRLLERRKADGLRIIPLIVEPCAWEAVPWLARLQCHPRDRKPLAKRTRPEADSELAELAHKIRNMLRSEKRRRATRTG